ncbi:MAG: methionine--tRNA ligase [Nitrososphaerota archaeon]|nr:methionine--tRNA ligase [Candidatus Aenigmarchaeota archaeon]
MKKNKFYITTPIYYVNDKPHIGHTYTTVAADVLARWNRMLGKDVFFLTGTDEHGQKIEKTAISLGKDPKEFVNEIVKFYISLWKRLNIEYSDFIRTSEKRHEDVVLKVFKKLQEKGDIYKGIYEGWYCIPDETFWTDFQVKDRKCPECGREVERMKEEAYFFRLSKYQNKILNWLEKNPDVIEPKSRYNEILSFVKNGLEDISISRKSVKWGIPVPGDPNHTIYVWIDALSNYISALDYPNGKKFKKYWPADIHLVGKEITRFHAIIWPAILFSLGLEPPKKIFAHGWWTVEGQKMSKSLGNVIDPNILIDKFGADAVRYYLLREMMFGEDGNFSEKEFISKYNTQLADELGNLVNRILILAEKYFNGKIPKKNKKINKNDLSFIGIVDNLKVKLGACFEKLQFSIALDEIWKVIQAANKYINDNKPWEEKDEKRKAEVIYNVLEAVRIIATSLYPFMPETSEKIIKYLGYKNYNFSKDNLDFGILKSGQKILRGEILFKKIEEIKENTNVSKEKNLVDILDFKKMDIRIGKIETAEEIPGSDKLLKLIVNIGEEKRQIVAGIKKQYMPGELKGKNIVVICNLKPAIIKGVKSEGMLLAAGTEPILIIPERDVKPGEKVS